MFLNNYHHLKNKEINMLTLFFKKNNTAVKLTKNTMFYQISKNSLQSNKVRNLYWVWYINKKYNRLSIFKNLKSLILIIINSIKKYGIK